MQAASRKNAGFSLTEVLLAVGTLAVGMVFVAGVFPAAILLNTQAAERTIAAAAADEAFAKVRIIAANPNPAWRIRAGDFAVNQLEDFERLVNDIRLRRGGTPIDPDGFIYPSADIPRTSRQYCWSALCRRLDPGPASRSVQVTVFVSRRSNSPRPYWDPVGMHTNANMDRPTPFPVPFTSSSGNELELHRDYNTLINDGYIIAHHDSGRLYRVLERVGTIIRLDNDWQGGIGGGYVWVVPPPDDGGRAPCIAVYQRVVEF